jgi:hypothetical protein
MRARVAFFTIRALFRLQTTCRRVIPKPVRIFAKGVKDMLFFFPVGGEKADLSSRFALHAKRTRDDYGEFVPTYALRAAHLVPEWWSWVAPPVAPELQLPAGRSART